MLSGRIAPMPPILYAVAALCGLPLLCSTSPPSCVPVPLDVAGYDSECVITVCPQETPDCGVGLLQPDGAPCDDDGAQCRAGLCVQVCVDDVGPRACGPDGYGGSCGTCADDEFCSAGTCIPEGGGPGPYVELVGEYPARALAVDIDGDVAYLAGEHMLFTLDIAGDGDPYEMGRVGLDGIPNTLAALPDEGVAAVGMRAPEGGLRIIDATDADNPRVVARALGDTTFQNLRSAHGLLYAVAPDQNVVYILDLSLPQQPDLVGVIQTLHEPHDIAFANGYAYVAVAEAGLEVFQLTEPHRARAVAREFDWSVENTLGLQLRPGEIEGLAIHQGHLLACRWHELLVLDLENPQQPSLRSYTQVAGSTNVIGPQKLATTGDHAYLVSQEGEAGVIVVNLSDIENPVTTAHYSLGCTGQMHIREQCSAWGVAATEQRVYVAYDVNGLAVMEAGLDRSVPGSRGFFRTAGHADSFVMVDDMLVAAGVRPGLLVFDIDGRMDPRASRQRPIVVGHHDLRCEMGDCLHDRYPDWSGCNTDEPTPRGWWFVCFDTPPDAVMLDGDADAAYLAVDGRVSELTLLPDGTPELATRWVAEPDADQNLDAPVRSLQVGSTMVSWVGRSARTVYALSRGPATTGPEVTPVAVPEDIGNATLAVPVGGALLVVSGGRTPDGSRRRQLRSFDMTCFADGSSDPTPCWSEPIEWPDYPTGIPLRGQTGLAAFFEWSIGLVVLDEELTERQRLPNPVGCPAAASSPWLVDGGTMLYLTGYQLHVGGLLSVLHRRESSHTPIDTALMPAPTAGRPFVDAHNRSVTFQNQSGAKFMCAASPSKRRTSCNR